jgi:hypothetical protein
MKIPKKFMVVFSLCLFMVGILVFNGCAPRQRATVEGDEALLDVSAMTVEWSPQSDCAMCHSTEDLSRDDMTTAAGMHGPSVISEQVDCMTCHDDVTNLAVAHDEVLADDKAPTRLRATKVTVDTCTASGCHDDEMARKEMTAGLTLLTDENGTTVNPHDLPTGDGHSAFTCSSCHKGHAPAEPEKFCLSCHHMKIYECGNSDCHE